MQIQLTPENAAFIASEAADSYCPPDRVVNDIIAVYKVASAMLPIIPPPTADRDAIDDWEPPEPT